MKHALLSFFLIALLLAGCVFEAPLATEHTIAIDNSVLGLWEEIPEEGKDPSQVKQMTILKFSDTEYLLHYPNTTEGIYYRAYPIEVGGISCVQIQAIGTGEGPMENENKNRFHVITYQIKNGQLEVRAINTTLIDENLKTTSELQQAFLKHKDNPALFGEPGMYHKAEK